MRMLLMLTLLSMCPETLGGEWKKLPPLPDKEGFAGPFAGVSHGALLVAGGANFPGKKPWEGGKKVWYDTVFVLEQPGGPWKVADKLPRPLGYGVCVTHGDGVVCVGGSDAGRHYADVFRLEWKNGKLITTTLPSLPKSTANACAALVGDVLYVAGGQETPDAKCTLNAAWRMNLAADKPTWEVIEPCPAGGRMLAVAAGCGGSFWLAGGVDLVQNVEELERRYLKDGYRYQPGQGWKRVADLPRPVVAAPTPAPADASGFCLMGGDDGSQVGVAPGAHQGFSKQLLRFDLKGATWTESGVLCASPVTVPCVAWNKFWVVPSGEVRPGVRSPNVWAFQPESHE